MSSVALLMVGDELLAGEIRDENGPWLLERLRDLGARAVRQVTVPDEEEAICQELRRLRALADHVVVSGGIGPTHDDVTRQAIARVLGVALMRHAGAEVRVRHFYGDSITEAELRMADLPEGASLLRGERTGTWGFRAGGVYALPGVPFLFRDLVQGVESSFRAPPLHRRSLRTQRREGEIADALAAVQRDLADVAIGSYPVCEEGRWHVRVVLRGRDSRRLEAVARALGPALAGSDRAG